MSHFVLLRTLTLYLHPLSSYAMNMENLSLLIWAVIIGTLSYILTVEPLFYSWLVLKVTHINIELKKKWYRYTQNPGSRKAWHKASNNPEYDKMAREYFPDDDN